MLDQDAVWKRILEFGKSNKGKLIPLLNHKRESPFTIIEASEEYIRIDKLPIKMTKPMFLGIYDYLKSRRGWVPIRTQLKDLSKKNFSTVTWMR